MISENVVSNRMSRLCTKPKVAPCDQTPKSKTWRGWKVFHGVFEKRFDSNIGTVA